MLKRSLAIILHEDINTGEVLVSVSCPLVGDFEEERIMPIVQKWVASFRSDGNFNGMRMRKIFEAIQSGRQLVSFTQYNLDDYILESSINNDGEEVNVYDYIYVLNPTKSYHSINSNSEHFPEHVNDNGLFINPESIMVIDAIPIATMLGIDTSNVKKVEYNISIREKMGS